MLKTEQLPYKTDNSIHRRCSIKKSCSQKFRNIHRKTPVLESLFHELQACNFIKKRLQRRCFPIAKFLRNTYFKEHLLTAASKLTLRSDCFELCFWTVASKAILT